ncbi:PepSY domain-containing protein [Streptomyces sp. NPDC058534]|uniref:PepSY domain-containing protein n=1 Tax=Streptomyces sp. NPDC058534 TaxID=3346541 RepID=UPI00365CBC8D
MILPTPRATGGARRCPPLAGTAMACAFALLALAGCDSEQQEAHEVLPMLEVPADEAIRLSLEEVPGSDLAALHLRQSEGDEPVWDSNVVAQDGTRHLVRVDGSRPKVLSAKEVPDEDAGQRKLIEQAKILPEQAVREVTKPEFGKVTSIEIDTKEGRVVWNVDVTTIERDNVHTYDVDAKTGEVLDRGELSS